MTYDSMFSKNGTECVSFENGLLKMFEYCQWGFEKDRDSLKQKIIDDNFTNFPIDHRVSKETNKPLKHMWENTKVTATEIHFLD